MVEATSVSADARIAVRQDAARPRMLHGILICSFCDIGRGQHPATRGFLTGTDCSDRADQMTISSDEPELRALMLAGLDGDEASHKMLLTKLSAYLRAYFKNRLARSGRGPSDAEDLVQETLIALHLRRHTYDRSQPLTPWVYAIARYRLIDYLRRTNSTNRAVPVEEAEGVFATDDVSAIDSGLDLAKFLTQLTPKVRQAVQFVKLDGLSVSEAAARTGMSQSAIKVAVHRGLKALSLLVRERSPS